MNNINQIYNKLRGQHQKNGWKINESALRQQAWMLNDRQIYESAIPAASSAAGAGAGGTKTSIEWITIYDTAWLYPQVDVNRAIERYKSESPSITIDGSNIHFVDINHLNNFYTTTWYNTAESNILNGEEGYNIAVGTRLKDINSEINLISDETGYTVITWRLVKQKTDQSTLNSGGDSPNNTIGYVAIYTDWMQRGIQDSPIDPSDPLFSTSVNPPSLGYDYGDTLRVQQTGDLIR
jgi:hypothetical protein